jgi:two-component system response regulator HydG
MAGSIAVALENAQLHEALRRETEIIHRDNVELRRAIGHHFRRIVGSSPELCRALDQAGRAAPTRATVTIRGETGTGKELVARAIHDTSDRSAGPFVAVNCAAIPETLLEAELFGHAKGAFTGAVTARKGKFELAHGGTLFLDEIGDLALALQAKILRVLERGEIQPLGREESRQVDVRILTATHQDLRARVAAGQFREDLYWRINVITLELPPLRERRDDLPVLIRHLLDLAAAETGRGRLSLARDAETALIGYDYPGNIRELENILRRAAILATGTRIGLEDLPSSVAGRRDRISFGPTTNAELKAAKARAASTASQAVEQRFLVELLRASGGSVTAAARRVGMNRSWLHQLIRRHGLDAKALGETDPPA